MYEQLRLSHQQQHHLRHTVCTSTWDSRINKNTIYGILCVRATETLASTTTPFTAYCVYEQLRLSHQQKHHLRHTVCTSIWVSGINNNTIYVILCVRASEFLASTTTPFTSYCVYEHLSLWHQQQHQLRHTVCTSNWVSGIINNTNYVILCVRATKSLASTTTPFTSYCVYEHLSLWHQQQQHHLRHTVCTSIWVSGINNNIFYGKLCVRAPEGITVCTSNWGSPSTTTPPFTSYWVYEHLSLWHQQQHLLRHTVWMGNWGSGINNNTIYVILCVRASESLASTTTPFTSYCVYEQLRLWHQKQHHLRHTVCTSNWGSGINKNTIYDILCVRASESLASTTTPFTSYCVYEHQSFWHQHQHHLRHTACTNIWVSGINNNIFYGILCVRATEGHTVCTSNWGSCINNNNTFYVILSVRASESLASTTTPFTS